MDAERKTAAQFGGNLLRAGLSQKKLGFLTSLHRTEISLLERGRREPRLGTIVKLASVLTVSLNMLVEGTGWEFKDSPAKDRELG